LDGDQPALLVRGCSAAHIDRLTIVPTEFRELRGVQSMAGRFQIRGDDIVFVPRFPLVAHASYSLLLDGTEVASVVAPHRAASPVATVRTIAPTASEIPFNQLKLYIEFTQPMSEGWAASAIEVRRADDGKQLAGVFLPLEPELWDPLRQRLTVLFDPGRIKRGLAPNAEAGYPLVEGEPILVVVNREFRDAENRRLVAAAVRHYAVGPAVRARIDPARWSIQSPLVGTRDPLVVVFDRPLDRALLEHSLVVETAAGRVEGTVQIEVGERRWRFAPSRGWRAGNYRIRVDTRLEDLAGNSLTRVFDRDLTCEADTPVEVDQIILDFRVG
jgi:hypothetical protein